MSTGERYGAEPRDDPSVQRLVANVDPHLFDIRSPMIGDSLVD